MGSTLLSKLGQGRGRARSLAAELFHLVNVVLEGHHELVPAWQSSTHLKGDKLCEPGDVGDLLLLKLQVGVEAAVVEAVFEGQREFAGRLNEHDLI